MIDATFSIPHEALALERALRDVPEMRVEAERTAARSTEWVMPCLWITGAEFDAVEEAVTNDPTVDEVVETREFDEEVYCQIEWIDAVERRVDTFVDKEGLILSVDGDEDGWRVKVRFASREQFEAFREHFEEQDYSFELLELFEPETPHQTYGGLTPDQREALLAAAEHGYFDVPRKITGRELAEKLGISHQALSERLRRGTRNIVTATLAAEADRGR